MAVVALVVTNTKTTRNNDELADNGNKYNNMLLLRNYVAKED